MVIDRSISLRAEGRTVSAELQVTREMNPRTRATIVGFVSRSGIVLVLLLNSGWNLGCRDHAEDVTAGITEAQARNVLGKESWELTEKTQIRSYLAPHAQCDRPAAKVLVYDRAWFRSDVFVAIDDAGRVICRFDGQLVKQ